MSSHFFGHEFLDRTTRECLAELDALSAVLAKLVLSQLGGCLVLSKSSLKFSRLLFRFIAMACLSIFEQDKDMHLRL